MLAEGAAREIDAGKVLYRAWAGHDAVGYFANVASAGMSGAVAQRANTTSKALGGKVSFLVATLAVFAGWKASRSRCASTTRHATQPHVRRPRRELRVPRRRDADDTGRLPDDGLFDVLLIGDITRSDLALTMPKIYRGTHLPHTKAELLRGRAVAVDADTPLPVQLDGEQPGTTPARFEICRGRYASASPRGSRRASLTIETRARTSSSLVR